MIISTKKGTPKEELEKIVDKFEKQGLDVTLITGKDYNVFGLVGDTTKIDERDVLANPWIDNVTRVSAPYKRANRLFHPADSIIDCGGVKIGRGEKIAVMAGPCSIEGEEQALRIANGVKAGGASLFRGGAYKPRTSPYSFQGLETEGILDMVKAREATGMPIVFRVAVKPTPSIAQPQHTVDFSAQTDAEITVQGRHDPCIVHRAVPVVEAAAALGALRLLKF